MECDTSTGGPCMHALGMVCNYLNPQKPMLDVHTDASRTKGLGGTSGDEWFSMRCLRHFPLKGHLI